MGEIVFLAKNVKVISSRGTREQCYILLVRCAPHTHAVAVVETPEAMDVPFLTIILREYNQLILDQPNGLVRIQDLADVQSPRFQISFEFPESSDYWGFVGAFSRAMKTIFDHDVAVVRQVTRTFMVASNAGQL